MNCIARLLAPVSLLWAGIAAGAPVPSTPYVWRNVVIGGGGFSPDILFSSAEKGLAYLRTDVGGAYRWDASEQRWIPLEDSIWQDSYFGIESIAPDPHDANVVYLAAGMYSSRPRRDHAERRPRRARGRITQCRSGWEATRTAAEWASGSRSIRTAPRRFCSARATTACGAATTAARPGTRSRAFRGAASVRLNRITRTAECRSSSSTRRAERWVRVAGHLRRDCRRGAQPSVPVPRWRPKLAAGGRRPALDMLPAKAAIASDGTLYVDYCTGLGPNGVDDGAVWKLDTRSGKWTDITPVRGPDAEGGYMGLSIDRRDAGRLAVSTVDRWNHHDTIWLSKDAGAHWTSLRERSSRDVSEAPFLGSEKPENAFGGWIAGLAFDPFDGGTLAYTTGGTVYRTADSLKPAAPMDAVGATASRKPCRSASPARLRARNLVSGIGDVHGFVHERLDAAPPAPFMNPDLPNTNNLDYAGEAPNVFVRSASPYVRTSEGVSLGWSADGGHSWHETGRTGGR